MSDSETGVVNCFHCNRSTDVERYCRHCDMFTYTESLPCADCGGKWEMIEATGYGVGHHDRRIYECNGCGRWHETYDNSRCDCENPHDH